MYRRLGMFQTDWDRGTVGRSGDLEPKSQRVEFPSRRIKRNHAKHLKLLLQKKHRWKENDLSEEDPGSVA